MPTPRTLSLLLTGGFLAGTITLAAPAQANETFPLHESVHTCEVHLELHPTFLKKAATKGSKQARTLKSVNYTALKGCACRSRPHWL